MDCKTKEVLEKNLIKKEERNAVGDLSPETDNGKDNGKRRNGIGLDLDKHSILLTGKFKYWKK